MARGGTSLLAAVVDALGFPMLGPESGRDGHYETPTYKQPVDDEERWRVMLCRARERDAADVNWGFKAYANRHALAKFYAALRNVHLIIIFRDLVAMAQSRELLPIAQCRAIEAARGERLAWQLAKEIKSLVSLYTTFQGPVALVSMERLRTAPEAVIASLAEFLQVTPSCGQWVEALSRIDRHLGGYLLEDGGQQSPTD
jgi:hypothetical protein